MNKLFIKLKSKIKLKLIKPIKHPICNWLNKNSNYSTQIYKLIKSISIIYYFYFAK